MKELWTNLKGWQKGGIIVGFLGIILIIVIAIVFMNNGGLKVEITFPEKVSIPSNELKRINGALEGVIRDNTENFNNYSRYRGVARNYNETNNDDSFVADFIVDFDDIEESYKVFVSWSTSDKDDSNITISCPLLQSKYPGTSCVTEVNSSSDIVGYLPYEEILSSGEKYGIVAKYSGIGRLYLEVTTDGNPEQAVLNAREWVESIGFDPNDYLFYIQAQQYVQANHSETNDANVNKNLPYFLPNVYNVYPVTDENNNVTSINAEIIGCTDYQTAPVEEMITDYLNSKGINYPLNFDECYNIE